MFDFKIEEGAPSGGAMLTMAAVVSIDEFLTRRRIDSEELALPKRGRGQ